MPHDGKPRPAPAPLWYSYGIVWYDPCRGGSLVASMASTAPSTPSPRLDPSGRLATRTADSGVLVTAVFFTQSTRRPRPA